MLIELHVNVKTKTYGLLKVCLNYQDNKFSVVSIVWENKKCDHSTVSKILKEKIIELDLSLKGGETYDLTKFI